MIVLKILLAMSGSRTTTIASPGDGSCRRPSPLRRRGRPGRFLAVLAVHALPTGAAIGAEVPGSRPTKSAVGRTSITRGVPLAVEVFAYRNDYQQQELRLALRPITISGSSFPPDRAPLDLTSLDDFFHQGGQLEGARTDPGEGLVLFANFDQHDSFAGTTVRLADLAVAHRAIFHAADNDAFVSLDTKADPNAATLAADRRLKTVCSGLDRLLVLPGVGQRRCRFARGLRRHNPAAVARLKAISAWRKRSKMSWLDLDALLAVELPALSTPRSLERSISTEYLAIPPNGNISEAI